MQIFRSGMKCNIRKESRAGGLKTEVRVGVEETKEDRGTTAKCEEDKEGERECTSTQIKEPATMCKEKKRREDMEVRQKHKLNLVNSLHCAGTAKWNVSAGVISVTDKEAYAQRGVRRGAGSHRERRDGLT